MSDFDSDERSVQDSRPRELYTLVIGNQTYRLASGVRSISYGGNIYKAFQISRNEAGVSEETNSPKQLQITLPMSHPACQRYMAYATPPKIATVSIARLQLNSGGAIGLWSGDIVSIGFSRHMATFLVTTTASRVMMRVLPTVTVGDQCAHALYDRNCTINRDSYKVTATVIQVDGRKIKVDIGSGHANPWSVFGDVYHPGTGERMDIVSQQDLGPPSTVVWLTMQAPIVGLNTGDSVEVSPGCDHTIATCLSKFNNKDNFGGFPSLPLFNPFVFEKLGVWTGGIGAP